MKYIHVFYKASSQKWHVLIIQGVFLALPKFKSTYLGQFFTDFKKLGRFRKVLFGATWHFLKFVIIIKIVGAAAKRV